MDSSKFSALLFICMFLFSSVTPILGCGYCGESTHKPKKGAHHGKPIKTVPPVTGPPVLPVPPVTVPPVTVPKIPVPPVTVPKVPVPPVTVPKLPVPPVLNPPSGPSGKPCPPGTPASPTVVAQPTCPIDVLKLGACVDLLGGLIHIGLGDPTVHTCCPILQGLAEAEAAVCLCTTLKVKLLNLNIFVPLALQVLLTCGKTPPPGFTCTI